MLKVNQKIALCASQRLTNRAIVKRRKNLVIGPVLVLQALIFLGFNINLQAAAKISAAEQVEDPNEMLLDAANKGDLERVETAIKAGADVDVVPSEKSRNPQLRVMGKYGFSPLLLASMSLSPNAKKIVEIFLQNNADVNKRNSNNNTPLMAAANAGNSDVIKFLIDNGADVNVKNNQNITALDIVAGSVIAIEQRNGLETVKLLLQAGANNIGEAINYINRLIADNAINILKYNRTLGIDIHTSSKKFLDSLAKYEAIRDLLQSTLKKRKEKAEEDTAFIAKSISEKVSESPAGLIADYVVEDPE